MPHSYVKELVICINAQDQVERLWRELPFALICCQSLGDQTMQSHMMAPAETENGFALLLRLNWDRALSASFILLSLWLGSWLAAL
jgi:hypothetical protein